MGTAEQRVVLLEVQMHGKAGFKHRVFAQTARFLQLHPKVLHLAVVVLVPHRRLNLGPALLPQQLQASTQQILERRPDLLSAVQTIPLERLPLLMSSDIENRATGDIEK